MSGQSRLTCLWSRTKAQPLRFVTRYVRLSLLMQRSAEEALKRFAKNLLDTKYTLIRPGCFDAAVLWLS